MAGSRTTPPLPTSSRPASNCGLTSATSFAPALASLSGDSSTFDKVPIQGPAGVYGQQADTVVIKNLYQHNYAATAAVFKLPGLKMSFSSEGCK